MYKKLLSSKEMKEIDSYSIKKIGIDEDILIENASLALLDECPKVKTARIFCGRGNNGEDGYALARHLFLRGVDVEIISLRESKNKNAMIDEKLGIKITPFKNMEDKESELYVDAVFGTGLKRNIEGDEAKAIEYINEKEGFKLSVDIPSGVNADTGQIFSCAVKADKTVTFAFYKPGLFIYPGKEYSKEVVLKDISLVKNEVDSKKYLVEEIALKKRDRDSNKGNYGNLLTVTGSYKMSGAAVMASRSAIKSGCGLVTAGVPSCIASTVSRRLTEAMILPLPSEKGEFSSLALCEIEQFSKKANTLLIGCGIGNTKTNAYLVKEAINCFKGKNIVIDADGLNVLTDDLSSLKGTVITPHPKEMSRLTKDSVASIQKDRICSALSFAEKYECTVVLKGAGTVTAYPDGRVYLNTTGNPGMANGGSGDVLAGIIASFLAQGICGAVEKAVYIHGLAGDMAAENKSENAMSATDIIRMIPKAIKLMYDKRKM